jgi:hypothetical protein
MAVTEIRHGSLRVSPVTQESVANLSPWLSDNERLIGERKNSTLSTEADLFAHLGDWVINLVFALPADTRYSIVDVLIRLPHQGEDAASGFAQLIIHPGQADVDLHPMAQAIDAE